MLNIVTNLQTKISPLLIIGTQRSGSNLLRLMLNQSPAIEAPHPPHILQTFFPLLKAYGDLTNEGNFRQLVSDVVGFIKVNPVPWRNVELEENEVFELCRRHTLPEVYRVVYTLKAQYKNARYWCCKSMANVYYIPEIEQAGLEPYYLYLVRDGRDVAASFKNAIVGEKHMYFIAQKWVQEQELALQMIAQYDATHRFGILKYEEFLKNPSQALSPILNALGLEWSGYMLDYYKSDEARYTAAAGDMWKNVIKPLDSSNMRHYSEKLSAEEIRIFERVAGNTLQKLGYPLDYGLNGNTAAFTAAEIQEFKTQNEKMKIEARKEHTLDASARAAQESFLNAIKSRLAVAQ